MLPPEQQREFDELEEGFNRAWLGLGQLAMAGKLSRFKFIQLFWRTSAEYHEMCYRIGLGKKTGALLLHEQESLVKILDELFPRAEAEAHEVFDQIEAVIDEAGGPLELDDTQIADLKRLPWLGKHLVALKL